MDASTQAAVREVAGQLGAQLKNPFPHGAILCPPPPRGPKLHSRKVCLQSRKGAKSIPGKSGRTLAKASWKNDKNEFRDFVLDSPSRTTLRENKETCEKGRLDVLPSDFRDLNPRSGTLFAVGRQA